MTGFYDNSVCWKCGKKWDYICDYCGDPVCETDVKEDGQGYYFCRWNCCKEFHQAMKKKF